MLASPLRLRLRVFFFFFKQKTAYEVRISDWISDVCSSDLAAERQVAKGQRALGRELRDPRRQPVEHCALRLAQPPHPKQRLIEFVDIDREAGDTADRPRAMVDAQHPPRAVALPEHGRGSL